LDEVWDGVLHVIPAPSFEHAEIATQLARLLGPPADAAGLTIAMHEFNLGESEHDYRVPDGGLHRGRPRGIWHSTAALVVEILSPGDETWDKQPFYAGHGVDEILIVDPLTSTVHWLALKDDTYFPMERSGLIDLGPDDLARQINWPDGEPE
jgi:Uma2 family endonuclease